MRRQRIRSRRGRLITAGFVGGVVAGLVLWSLQMRRSRRDLFSDSAIRRLAALGHLGGQPSLETAHILAEYVRWEKKSVLKRRAERLLSRMRARVV